MNIDWGRFWVGFLVGTIAYWLVRIAILYFKRSREPKAELKPVDEITEEDASQMRKAASAEASIQATAETEQEEAPAEK